MRSKDTKRTIFDFLPYECDAVKEYLEEMAEKGWLLQSVEGVFLKFKKIEPQKINYSVDALTKISNFDDIDSDAALEYREYCKAAGWNYICRKGKIQIFYSENDKKATSIHTDEEEKFKSVFKASLLPEVIQLFIVLMFINNIYSQYYLESIKYTLASNLNIFGLFFMVSIIFMCCISIISFLIWVIKARNRLKAMEPMPYNSYKQIRIKYILYLTYGALIYFILVISSIYNYPEVGILNVQSTITIFIPITIGIIVQWFINKKGYSKKTNIAIISITILASVYIFNLIGGMFLTDISKYNWNKIQNEKAKLTLLDFGNNENPEGSSVPIFIESVLAKVIHHIDSNEDKQLEYTILESQYSWVIKFEKSRSLDILTKKSINLQLQESNLPNNISVYSDSNKKIFLLVSKDKVVEIKKGFDNVGEEEFLNTTYKKLFQ